MTDTCCTCSQDSAEQEANKYLKRNYTAHSIEGGFFMGAMALVSVSTVMPKIIASLGGPDWLIAQTPLLSMLGGGLMPILTAHRVERLHRYKPFLLVTGVLQRLPYLLAGLALLLAAGSPHWAIAAVALAPLISSICGGVSLTAWQQLLAKTVPNRRRASVIAVRHIIGSALGLAGALLVRQTLKNHPGEFGYGLLYLYTFALLILSYAFFATIRETGRHPERPDQHLGLVRNLHDAPDLFRRQRNLQLYLLASIFRIGRFVLIPFLILQACAVTGRGEELVGDLLIMQMIGAILGNLIGGWVGDRAGTKLVCLLGNAGNLVMVAIAAFSGNLWMFGLVFFLLGVGGSFDAIGFMTLTIEIGPEKRKSTFLAVMSLLGILGMLTATTSGAAVRNLGNPFLVACIISGVCLMISCALLLPVRDPRFVNVNAPETMGPPLE